MRYIGSKEKALSFIEQVINDAVGNVDNLLMADLFSGTTSVAKHFKKLGAKLITNDYMAFSYVLQMAYIKNNRFPKFDKLNNDFSLINYYEILQYLNNLKGEKNFFYNEYTIEGSTKGNYQRNYFSEENAKLIDAIRVQLNIWKERDLIEEEEFFILLASLIDAVTKVSNIAGTYGAFLKFDEKRKHKKINLEPIEFISSDLHHECFCRDIFEIIDKVQGDILYLDPPYNNRQYPPYYHILETVALYDKPAIYGKTGRRPYFNKISPFCIKEKARDALEYIVKIAQFKHIFISYSTDGLLKKTELIELLKPLGLVEVFDQAYRRYKSNSNGKGKDLLKELIFYVKK